MSTTVPEPAGYYSSSGLSELDNLSDSDWLDIASGNEDNDHDSLSDASEGEGEPCSLPLSRTSSSLSIGSSRGEVEAWEGFVDPNHGEGAATGMYPPPPVVAACAEQTPLELIPDIITDQDEAEDELVKEALDQSLTGTLTASRTSSLSSSGHSSNQASVRDLRLSFPDPLNSPPTELERSYEQVSVEEQNAPGDKGVANFASSGDAEQMTPELHEARTKRPDFQIHLYGTSTKHKWTVVGDFLKKVADGSGQDLIDRFDSSSEKRLVRTAALRKRNPSSEPLFNVVRIYDRTQDDNLPDVEVNSPIDSPSLAIVFLPANRLPSLAPHTAYLAVIANDYLSDVIYNNEKALRNAAEDDFELLNLPRTQMLYLNKSEVVNHQDIKYLNPRQVYRSLQSVILDEPEAPREVPFKGHATPANAAKVIAVVSVLLSIAFNASTFRQPAPTPTVTMAVPHRDWTSLVSVSDRSTSVGIHSAVKAKEDGAVTTLTGAALSVYNPGTTALSLTATPETKSLSPSTPPVSPVVPERRGIKSVLSDQATKIVDTLSAPAPTSEDTTDSFAPIDDSQVDDCEEEAEVRSDATRKMRGMNLVESLSETLGVTTKSIIRAINEDGGDLMDGLDDLMNAIKSQTDDLIKQSKGKARALQDQVQAVGEALQYRNNRAKTRAKALKRVGEELFTTAGEHIRERTTVAKDRARRIREVVEETPAWEYYDLAQREWNERLNAERNRRRGCFKNRGARGRRQKSFMDNYYSDCA